MATPTIETGAYKLITASTVVRTGAWQGIGLFVASNGTGGVEVYDAVTSGSNTCMPLTAFVTGTFYRLPVSGLNGITVRVSGTCAAVLSWIPIN